MSEPHLGRTSFIAAGLLVALLLGSPTRGIDLGFRDPAARIGFSLDPDQIHAGVQTHLGPVKSLRFRPSLDIGVGNGVRLASINGDLLFRTRGGRSPVFIGGGPGLNLIDVTSGVGEGRGVEAKLVFHGLAGLSFGGVQRAARAGRWRYFVEARAGFGDTPDAKLTAGIRF